MALVHYQGISPLQGNPSQGIVNDEEYGAYFPVHGGNTTPFAESSGDDAPPHSWP